MWGAGLEEVQVEKRKACTQRKPIHTPLNDRFEDGPKQQERQEQMLVLFKNKSYLEDLQLIKNNAFSVLSLLVHIFSGWPRGVRMDLPVRRFY